MEKDKLTSFHCSCVWNICKFN